VTRRFRIPLLAVWACLGLASSLFAQRNLTDIPDPDPELERKSFQVAEGFEVNLFAADPLLAKPIQMNFDPAGRLWMVSSEVYPQIKPGQTANDKVIVLEDRDGDGRSDRTSVFADGLLIPTGLEPGDGGVYVANSTELLHFKDTDNDGKADQRRVVLSGFGTEDTHHILHTLRWGYDGMLYFNQSVYIHSHIETPHGVRRLGGGGIWQFRPETMELDVFIRGLVNPWGYHFDRWGQSFATDGAGGEGINYCLPGASYYWAVGATRILPGLNPGSPKYCGEEVVSGRHLPDDWQGNIVTNDFRGNRVCRFVISDDGAGFASREQAELIKTRHVAFRPIDVKMGPDGAIYIADWYNPIIQHGEVDFRDPRRDHTRGRIWRVTAKGRPPVERPRLVGASTEDLLAALKAPEDWTRQNAKRVLKERGASVIPALAGWVKALDATVPEFEHQKLEALWTYQALDVVEPDLLASVLRANDPRIRAAATRVVACWHARLSDPVGLLAVQIADEHPRVRLEAVRSLARIPHARAAEIALRALDKPVDRFLDYALWLTARELLPAWLPEFQAGRFDFGGNTHHLIYALKAAASPAVVKPLVERLRTGRIPAGEQADALTLIATLGEPPDLALVFDLAVDPKNDPSVDRLALLQALIKATRQRKVRPAGDLSRLGLFLAMNSDALRTVSAEVAGLWDVRAVRPKLIEIARDAATSDPLRRAAIYAFTHFGTPESRDVLESLARADGPRRTHLLAIGALGILDAKAGAELAVDQLAHAKDQGEAEDLIGPLLQLKAGPQTLVSALAGKTLDADAAKLAVRVARASGREEPKLIDALTKAGGLSAASQAPTPEQMKALVAEVSSQGDAARGESVFRRKDMACLKCHAIAGAGGQVGSSLESIGASAPVDYLIDSLLQPGKAVKEGYHSLVVATNDGRVVTGIKVRQSDSELVLRDAEDREVAIPLATIDEQKPGGSLMPAGQTDILTRAEFVDLVRFLSELGKIGPYSVGKARVARRWRVPDGPVERVLPGSGELTFLAKGRTPAAWAPAYSLVSGQLPLASIPRFTIDGESKGFAQAQLDVSTPGSITLAFNSIAGLAIWIDGKPAQPATELAADLASGVHTITLVIDLGQRKDGILCTLNEAPGSSARAQWVVGK
jgi:putative heme-binding domain-containing protein